MLPLNISQADAMTANIVRKKDKSSLVRDRMHAIYLLYEGYDRQTCAHIIGCRPNTITDYIRLYNKEGLEGLRRLKYHKSETKLIEYQSAIQESLKELKPSTIREIRDHIHEKYGIDRSPERIRVFVKRIGLKYRKVGTLPGGKDVDKWLVEQADFLKLTLKPLIDKALSKEIDLLQQFPLWLTTCW
jgi:transposase